MDLTRWIFCYLLLCLGRPWSDAKLNRLVSMTKPTSIFDQPLADALETPTRLRDCSCLSFENKEDFSRFIHRLGRECLGETAVRAYWVHFTNHQAGAVRDFPARYALLIDEPVRAVLRASTAPWLEAAKAEIETSQLTLGQLVRRGTFFVVYASDLANIESDAGRIYAVYGPLWMRFLWRVYGRFCGLLEMLRKALS